MQQLPRLRNDLIVSRQTTAEGACFVVKDPASGRFFRLKEAEYFIARHLDGSAPLEVVRRRVEDELGAASSLEALRAFVEGLERLDLLETGAPADGQTAARARVRGSLLHLRFKAFDPDRLLERLVRRLGCFFTPHFVALSALVIAGAMAIALANWEEIARDVRSLWRFDALLFAWFTVLCVTALHELAHGLTCKHFGGQVHEMGFLLIYFQPAFYCNVSDAWLLPQRSQRLWVTFAGAHFELFLWGLATLVWWVAEPRTWISFVALVVMATSGIKTAFNLNPLVKLDGYYLLSDYLEIPNLRQRSMAYLRGLLGQLLGGSTPAGGTTPRERRIYLLYGLLAGVYSCGLLGYVVLAFGDPLVDRYRGVGAILFAGLLALLLRDSLRRLLNKASASLRRIATNPAWPRRRNLAVAAALAGLLLLGRMELTVAGPFQVLPIHNADVRAEVEGIVEKILVDEGTRVRAGDLIAQLADRDYRSALRQTEAEIAETTARLRMLRAGTRPEEIEVAKAVVGRADEELRRAQKLFSMTEAAFQKAVVSRKEFEEARAEVAVQGRAVEEERSRLEVLLAGNRKEEIEAAEAALSRLSAQREHLQDQIDLLRITTSIEGVVTTPSTELHEKPGQHVNRGDLIAEVYELRTITAEIAVSEKEIANVRPGGRVVLKSRAYPGLSFEGKVDSIAAATEGRDQGDAEPGAMLPEGERTILVRTKIDNGSLLLKPGMTGRAKIACGERRVFDLLTRGIARYLRVEFWSWW